MTLILDKKEHDQDPIKIIGGTSLRVYIYLVKKDSFAGVREVQRALGFKSPSTAKHHLDRLVEMGLAIKNRSGEYKAVIHRQGIISSILVFSGRIIPITIPVSLFGFSLVTMEIIMNGFRSPSLVIGTILISSVMLIEGLRIYRWLKNIV